MSQRIETFSVFATHILAEVYDAFPVPSELNKHKAVSAGFDFEVWNELQRKSSLKGTYLEIVETLLASDSPHLDADQRRQFEDMLSNTTLDSTEEEINKLETLNKEIDLIYKGTITFLEAEKYIRRIDLGWQLTEKGFGHLNKQFSESKVTDARGTLISRIKEQLTDPSKLGAQMLVQLTSSAFS